MKLAINLNRAIRTRTSNRLVCVFFCAFPITPWSDNGSPGAVLRWSTVSPELTAFLVVSSGERFFAGAGGYLIVVSSGGRPFPGDGDVFSQQKNQLMCWFFVANQNCAEIMQRHEWQHILFFAFHKDFMIEIHTFLIYSSGPTKNKIFRWSKQLPLPYPCSLMVVCVSLHLFGNRIQTICKQLTSPGLH